MLENCGVSGKVRFKQLKKGMNIDEKPDKWEDLKTLEKSQEWFSTKRSSYMDLIGSLIGYYVRTRASQFCLTVNPTWISKPNLENVDELLSICKNAIKPVILEIDVVDKTSKRFQHFPHISEEEFAVMKSDKNVTCTKCVKMFGIKNEFEDLAWNYLDMGHTETVIEQASILAYEESLSNLVESFCTAGIYIFLLLAIYLFTKKNTFKAWSKHRR